MKGSLLCALIYDLVWNWSLQHLSGWAERSGATGVGSWDQELVPGRSAPGAALALAGWRAPRLAVATPVPHLLGSGAATRLLMGSLPRILAIMTSY